MIKAFLVKKNALGEVDKDAEEILVSIGKKFRISKAFGTTPRSAEKHKISVMNSKCEFMSE